MNPQLIVTLARFIGTALSGAAVGSIFGAYTVNHEKEKEERYEMIFIPETSSFITTPYTVSSYVAKDTQLNLEMALAQLYNAKSFCEDTYEAKLCSPSFKLEKMEASDSLFWTYTEFKFKRNCNSKG